MDASHDYHAKEPGQTSSQTPDPPNTNLPKIKPLYTPNTRSTHVWYSRMLVSHLNIASSPIPVMSVFRRSTHVLPVVNDSNRVQESDSAGSG